MGCRWWFDGHLPNTFRFIAAPVQNRLRVSAGFGSGKLEEQAVYIEILN